MRKVTFNVLITVRKTKSTENGLLTLYARITQQGQRVEFCLNREIKPDDWDYKNSCVLIKTKESKDHITFVEQARQKIKNIRAELLERNKACTPEIIRNIFTGRGADHKGLLSLFDEHNERCKKLKGKDFAPGTVQRYETCRKLLAYFIKKQYKTEDIALKEINPKFIGDFEFYLKTERNCAHNTAIQYLKNVKKIIRIALANDLLQIDPYINIKFHKDQVDMAYLTEEELNKIMQKNFVSDRIKLVRDAYLFCCFTGLAFSDVKSLCPADIHQEPDGSQWIKKKRMKTKNWCHIPIMPAAQEILNRYRNDKRCQDRKVCLPVMSNQKMNSYLKEIADVCEIKKELSTHTARHTFATTVTLKNKVSIEVVSKMLGHSSINMTKKYARVVDDLIKNDMDKIMDKYSMVTVQMN